jgi:hypothetical protein
VTGELAQLADTAAKEAERLLVNARRALRRARTTAARLSERGELDAAAGRRRGRLARAVNDLAALLDATRRIAAQARQRIAGVMPAGATRRVSLHDPHARPIAKGRLGKPVEFGHNAQVVDNDDGIVLDHTVEPGNPADARNSRRPSHGSSHAPAASPHRHRRPRLRGQGHRRRAPRPRHPARGHPAQGQTQQGQAGRTTPTSLPTHREMAHRKQRPDQHPQTRLRLGPDPASTPPKAPGSGPGTAS